MDANTLRAFQKDVAEIQKQQAEMANRMAVISGHLEQHVKAEVVTLSAQKTYTLFIGVPVYKWPTDPHHGESVRKTTEHPFLDVTYRAVIGDAHIERARATVLMHYLKQEKPYDYFLNIDHDIEFHPDELYRMCQRMDAHPDVGVLGAPYAFKTDAGDKAGKIVCRPKLDASPTPDKIVDVWYCGTGFMLVRPSTITKLCKRYQNLRFNMNPDLDAEMPKTWALWNPILIKRPDWGKGNRELLSEDYSFCHRVWEMGERVALDLTVKLTHWNGDKKFEVPMHPEEVSSDGGGVPTVASQPDDTGDSCSTQEAA